MMDTLDEYRQKRDDLEAEIKYFREGLAAKELELRALNREWSAVLHVSGKNMSTQARVMELLEGEVELQEFITRCSNVILHINRNRIRNVVSNLVKADRISVRGDGRDFYITRVEVPRALNARVKKQRIVKIIRDYGNPISVREIEETLVNTTENAIRDTLNRLEREGIVKRHKVIGETIKFFLVQQETPCATAKQPSYSSESLSV